MFTVCQGCMEGSNEGCPLYVCATKDGFYFIGCIVLAIELDAYIYQRMDKSIGGNGEMSDMPE